MGQQQGRQARGRRTGSQGRRVARRGRGWIIIGLLALAAVAGVLLAGLPNDERSGNALAAESTTADLGQVPIDGGLLTARFALDVREPLVIERIEST